MILTLVFLCLLLWFLGLMTSYTLGGVSTFCWSWRSCCFSCTSSRAVQSATPDVAELAPINRIGYASRSADSGSTRVARDEGTATASSATTANSSDTPR